MIRPSDYCELDRRFVQFKHDVSTDDFALQSYDSHSAYFDWDSIGWADLLSKPGIAVILGEPGSGRSYEFKARCQHLMEADTPAFYLELHRLVDATPAQILGEQDAPRLHGWQRSSSQGIFFLDAVDEAKLERVSDFGLALENFSKALGSCRSHATVFISSRISEWSPETDLRLVAENLSAGPEEIKATSNSTRKKQEEKAPEIPVYVIAPLKREQVAKFAKTLGVADTPGFLAALDQRHAWEFARRPADVRFLVQYWKKHEQIGSLTDMLEESLALLLAETEEKRHRAIKFPLSPEQAWHGAETLAAATLFCRTLDFEITDTAVLGRRPGLKPLDCLPPSWTDIQSKALLDRPLFDSAIYGRVRFHHRRLAEYLAARWLRRRMENQCPPPVLHDLLFVLLPGGRRVIRPSRAPVAVWLTCIGEGSWVNDLRTWLLESSPQSFLRYGDPSRLPIVFRHQIIDAFVLRYKRSRRTWIRIDVAAVSRLADPALAVAFSKHIIDPEVSAGIKSDLLDLARQGQVSGCAEAALSILPSSPELNDLEASALHLISETGTPEDKARLATLVREDPAFTARHVGLIASALFPTHLDVPGLRTLLLMRQTSGHIRRLEIFFEQKSTDWCPFEVIEMLLGLVFTSPNMILHEDTGVPEWITGLLSSLVSNVLGAREISPERIEMVARACFLLIKERPQLGRDRSLRNIPNFEATTRRFPGLRRSIFWFAVRMDPDNQNAYGVRHIGSSVFYDILHFSFCDEDLEWLLEDAANKQNHELCAIAAWLVFDQYRLRKAPSKIVRRLKRAVSDSPELKREIKQQTWLVKQPGLLGWWYWLDRKRLFKKQTWERYGKALQKAFLRYRNTRNLNAKIGDIRAGRSIGWLAHLTGEASRNSGWAVHDWSKLTAKRGQLITHAVQLGCVAVWRSYEPSTINSSNATSNGVIIGLSGLQFLYQNNRLDFAQFTPADARRAARYAVNEMNGYSEWLEELARYHRDPVREVLTECIDHEWHASAQKGFWGRHLHQIGRRDSVLGPLVVPLVAEHVAGNHPANHSVLTAAIDLLIIHHGMEREEWSALAPRKLADLNPENPHYMTWLLICLQVNAAPVLDHLEQRSMSETEDALAGPVANFMISLCGQLRGDGVDEPYLRFESPDHLRPQHVSRFMRLACRFVAPARDFGLSSDEEAVPVLSDEARRYKDSIPEILQSMPGPEGGEALHSLLGVPELTLDHDWIRHLIDERMERDADGAAFHARDIRDFELHNESAPKSAADLFRTVQRRLSAIKHDVENADQSLRGNVRAGDLEVDLRRFIARELSHRSNHCYTAPQESVIRDEKRLDIRVENPSVRGPVVIEVKLGDQNERTLESLLADLERQLVQRYLQDENSRHGIYLIGYTGERSYWLHPDKSRRLGFEEVLSILEQRAVEIQNQNPAVESLDVIGIDFRPPSEASTARKAASKA